MPAANAYPNELKAEQNDPEFQYVSPCKAKDTDYVDTNALKKDRTDLFDEMKEACDLIKTQFNDVTFKNYVEKACLTYDKIFYKTDEPEQEDIDKRRVMHVLITVYISSHTLCRNLDNHKVHLHNTTTIAAKHLENCFWGNFPSDEEEQFIPILRNEAKAAIGQETIERYIKGKLTIANAQRDLKKLKDAPFSLRNDQALQDAVKLSIMLYQCCTANRKQNDRDTWYTGLPDLANSFTPGLLFDPQYASGYISTSLYDKFFDGDTHKFNKKVEDELGSLFATLYNTNNAPADNRFPDARVDNLGPNGSNVLSAQHVAYLRSLPRMDRIGVDAAHRTPCEVNIRKRITGRLSQLFDGANLSKEKMLKHIEDLKKPLSDGLKKLNKKSKSLKRKIWWLKKLRINYGDSAKWRTALEAQIEKVQFRLDRCERFRGVINEKIHRTNNANTRMDDLLDLLIKDMNSNHYWRESTYTKRFFDYFVTAARAVDKRDFFIRTETYDKAAQITYAEVLDKCPKNNPGNIVGNFPGLNYNVNDVKRSTDGRQNAWPWYLDWRVNKDWMLYDHFDFPPDKLSTFSSYTSWLWTEPPATNTTYGYHTIIWDPNIINLNRCVLTVGDKGNPRRSMLMLLQDVICKTKNKDGSDPGLGGMSAERFALLSQIISHIESDPPDAAVPKNALCQHWKEMIRKCGCRWYSKDNKMHALRGPVVECHMFGFVRLRDAVGLFMGNKVVIKKENQYINEMQTVAKVEREQGQNQHGWELQKYEMAREPDFMSLISGADTFLSNPNRWTMLGPPTSADLT